MSKQLRNFFEYDFCYAAFWLAVVVLLFFLPVAIGRQSLTQDVPMFYSAASPAPQVQIPWQVDAGTHTAQTIPFVRAGIQLLKQGTFPLWAGYSGAGQPLASEVAGELYYPLRLLFFFVWSSARAFDWYFLLRFFIAGLGMFFYLRAIGLRRVVSLWGGIAYGFTGYFILYISYPFLDIDSLLPWTLWMIERYCRKKDFAAAGLVGFFLALTIVVGQPQSTIIAFLFAALYFVWRAAVADKTRKERFSIVRHSIFILLIAFLVALPFIADFLTLASQGATVADWQSKGLLSFRPIQILHFLVTPAMMPEVAAAGHLFDRYENIIPYVGISVLLLFLLSFFIKKKPPQLAPLYAWTGFVILKNAGFPLVQWLGTLPVLSQIGWYKAYGPMAGAMVVCAAIAFEHILREHEGGSALRWHGFYTFIAAIPFVFGAAYLMFRNAFISSYVPNFDFFNRHPDAVKKIISLIQGMPRNTQSFVLYALQNHGGYVTLALFAEAGMFAALTLLIIYFLRRGTDFRLAAILMVVFTAFELLVYMPKIRDGFRYIDPYAKTPPYVSFLQNQMAQEGTSRTFSVGNVFNGYLGELYKIQQSQNNSAFKLRRYFAFLPDEILLKNPLAGIIQAERLPAVPQKFFDAYNVRYFLSEEILPAGARSKLIYDNDIKIYENNSALPKAYVVFQKETAFSPEQARSIFYGVSFDPHHSVILEDRNAISLAQIRNAPFSSSAAVVYYSDTEADITAKTDRDGVLVLTDVFYPGWQAYLDGKKVPTYPANVLFRGIYLPAGSHAVKFVYEPRWFLPSITVSFLTICGVMILAFYQSRKKIGAADTAI